MMKSTFIILCIYLGLSQIANSQGDTYSRLPFYNPGMFNPAATGLESKNFITTNISSKRYNTEFDPLRFDIGYERTIDKINSSFAVYYYYSQLGSLANTNTLGLSYSYKFKFSNVHFLKFGIQLNIIRHYIDYSRIISIYPDPCIDYIEKSGTKADINLGLWYSWKRLTIGGSVLNVFRPVFIPFNSGCSYEEEGIRLQRFFTFLAKYEIKLSNSFDLTPAIFLYTYSNYNSKFSDYLDYSLNFSYKKWLNLGTVYSPGRFSQWTVFAGAKIIKKINIQFTYGFPDNNVGNIGPFLEAFLSYSIN